MRVLVFTLRNLIRLDVITISNWREKKMEHQHFHSKLFTFAAFKRLMILHINWKEKRDSGISVKWH